MVTDRLVDLPERDSVLQMTETDRLLELTAAGESAACLA